MSAVESFLGLVSTVESFVEMAGAGYHHLESVYLGWKHEAAVVPAQGFQDWESHEAVLLHCGLYDMCECGMYVLPDFESAWNSLADARDMHILANSWAASEVGAKKGGSANCATSGQGMTRTHMYGAMVAKGKADLETRTGVAIKMHIGDHVDRGLKFKQNSC